MARQKNEPKTELAARFAKIREALELQRDVFALKIGISSQGLGNYERGDRTPDADVLSACCSVFGIDAHWLLTGQGEMFSDPTLIAKAAPPVFPAVMELLYKLVEEVNKQHHYKLSPAQTSHQAAELYNELITRITDITDMEEVDSIIPQLRHLYSKRSTKSEQQNNSSNVA